MAMINAVNFDVRPFGENVAVPDTPIAKIMYYLDCVCTVIDYNENGINRYRNYSNWAGMSDEEDRLIFLLALALSPDEFENRVFFNSPQLCVDSSNQFYEIGQVKKHFFIVQSLVIGGQQRQVKKIMAYKPIWMQRNYIEPMQRLIFRFSPEGQRQEAMRREAISQACTIS